MPKLSVVTACYNHGTYLQESAESVLASTEWDIELIIVVDGATDDSMYVAQSLHTRDTRVRVIDNQQNRGLAFSQNVGISAARSPWVLKVDADDKIDARYIASILRAADADPRRNVIFAPAKHFGTRSDEWVYPPFNPRKMIDEFLIPGPAAFKRELWEAVGGYDETMRSAEDWDLYIRAQLAVGLVPHQIREPGLFWWYRVHNGPRASAEGLAKVKQLQEYWRGHTRETVLARSRSWGAWKAERMVAA